MDSGLPKKPYLHVRVSCPDPRPLEGTLNVLNPLYTHHSEEKGILSLVFPSDNVDWTLRRLSGMSAQFEILEAGLSSRLETSGYRLMLPGGISMVSPGPGITPGAGDIVLKQNLSFGTGHHPTTELSIKLLREAFTVADIKAVFDLDTGSGILAFCAAKFGARKILAADIDFRACEEAIEGTITNDLQNKILVVRGSIEVAHPGCFDLVLANLTIGTLTTLAGRIPQVLRKSGLAVISGFTTGQVDQILRYIGTTEVIKNINQEGWAALLIKTAR